MEKAVHERLEAKSRDSQLFETLTHQFEFSPKTAEAIMETVKETYELHRWNPDQDTDPGQVIAINAKHGPRLRELPMVTVILTVDNGQEDQEVRRSHGTKPLRQVRITRIAEEALDQGGIVTQEDFSDLLAVDVRTVRRDVQAFTQQGVRIQTRGAYHDIGSTLSHKVWIVGLYLQYHTYSDIARRTRH
ncbi:DUF1670 domain-containing protein [Salicibibacter kimchii]|uniref:DUF1670 domain-containing protein n=1 Tax=Salicibibacter kimchii TaxID=2099786 RepID=A0A345C2E6_9BACI|nr:DUF1670 domain-containing protein [Salicibibacter kimchii]